MKKHSTDALATTLRHARRLHETGLALVALCRPLPDGRCSSSRHIQPCHGIGKRPLVKGYPSFAIATRRWSDVEDELMRFTPSNIGIVTGGPLVIVEADSFDAELEILRIGGSALRRTPTRARRRGRGRAYLLRGTSGVPFPTRSKLGKSKAIDVRGASGILVAPPSLHRTGHILSWVKGRAPWEVEPVAMSDALEEFALRRTDARERRRHFDTTKLAPRLSPRIQFFLGARPAFMELWNGMGKAHGDDSTSGYDYAIACLLLDFGADRHEVAEAILFRAAPHGRGPDYASRTVAAACARRRRA